MIPIFGSVSFCLFPFSKSHSVRAYLDTILKALHELSFLTIAQYIICFHHFFKEGERYTASSDMWSLGAVISFIANQG